jgi:lysyl-tRNA synthetase class II
MSNFNMLNLDLQGVELKALRGAGDYLNHIDYIYTEVNNDSIYKDNDLIIDIDEFLRDYKFIRVETAMLSEQWGDAFYIKSK